CCCARASDGQSGRRTTTSTILTRMISFLGLRGPPTTRRACLSTACFHGRDTVGFGRSRRKDFVGCGAAATLVGYGITLPRSLGFLALCTCRREPPGSEPEDAAIR